MTRILLLTVAIVLGACASLDLGTARAVARLDPLTVDPADIAVRLTPPAGMDVQDGSARLRLSARRGTEERGTDIDLRRSGDVWTIPAEDHARLRAEQAAIAAWKADDPSTEGSLSVTMDPCRTGALPLGQTGSVAIRLAPGAPFLPLLTDAPVQRLLGEGDAQGLPLCRN